MHELPAAGVGGVGCGPDQQLDIHRSDRNNQRAGDGSERRRERQRLQWPEHWDVDPGTEYNDADAWSHRHYAEHRYLHRRHDRQRWFELHAFGQHWGRNTGKRYQHQQHEQHDLEQHPGLIGVRQHYHAG